MNPLRPSYCSDDTGWSPIRRLGMKLGALTMVTLLAAGCQVHKFDRNSVNASIDAGQSYGTGTVPFMVVGDEQPAWLVPDSPDAPQVTVQRSQELVESPDFNFLSFTGYMVTLSLIPYWEEKRYADVYELKWQGESLLESRVEYSIDAYFSVYFPTPLMFLGTVNDEAAEKAVARDYVTDLHKGGVLATIDQQRQEFERANPQTAEEIAAYLTGPGRNSVYRPSAVNRLIELAPEENALAYHEANSNVPGYVDLLPVEHQAWLIGPEGLRGFDLEASIEQGVATDDLLVRMLNAYPAEQDIPVTYEQVAGSWQSVRKITSGYYTGLTDEHRAVLKQAGIPEGLVDRMTNDSPSKALLAAARTGKLRDADGNIRIPTKEELLEQLVRKDNQGKYMSPYTSDDVLAEWVDLAINANIGSTAGSTIGAAAGAYAAEKALEQVPFVGSFIGGMVGSEIGETVGRQSAISASGGWEKIRGTSDRSFDDLQSMVRYLKAKYGSTGNFADAMEATGQIYPELADALAQAY